MQRKPEQLMPERPTGYKDPVWVRWVCGILCTLALAWGWWGARDGIKRVRMSPEAMRIWDSVNQAIDLRDSLRADSIRATADRPPTG